MMRVVVVGAGAAGLSAARRIVGAGHSVRVLDKGSRVGGRLATKQFGDGGRADYGAQFFTARSEEFKEEIATWLIDGIVREWCRGFGVDDGHPRFVARNGMAELAARMAAGLDVKSSVTVGAVRRSPNGLLVNWTANHGGQTGSMEADVVVLTAPVPQSASLVGEWVSIPEQRYTPTLSLLVVLAGPPSIPSPGGLQLDDDPVWSWIADNTQKGVSSVPAVTLHTRADVASARWDENDRTLTADLLNSARPWLGGAPGVKVALHRWRFATPVDPHFERCWVSPDGEIVLAGDAFGGPKVEGAFRSGLAAAAAVVGHE